MKIKLSKSQWEGIGKKAGWMKLAETHNEIAKRKGLASPCSAHDLITVSEGLQCGNCLALTRDHGKTWEEPKDSRQKITKPQNVIDVDSRQKITKPQNIIDVPQEMKASNLFKQFLQEGKKPRQASEELLDILTTGTFAAIEEPKRTEMINNVIEKFSK